MRTVPIQIPISALGRVYRALHGRPLYGAAIPNFDVFLEANGEIQEAIAEVFPVREWGNAARVSKHESGWDRTARAHDSLVIAYNPTRVESRPRHPDGSWNDDAIPAGYEVAREDSRGLFQVNINVHVRFAGVDLYDPTVNVHAALEIFNNALKTHGNGWRPWTYAQIHEIKSVVPKV